MTTQIRPPLNAADTFDKRSLSGQLSTNGVATLHAEEVPNGTALPPPVMNTPPRSRAGSSDSNESTFESYDVQNPHPDTLVDRGSGEELEVTTGEEERLNVGRRKSIPIRLERTGKKGRYMLTADDPELKEILKLGADRQKGGATNGQKSSTSKLRELVFTRRFTTFDRQNPSNTESPYLGFYVLFWIAMGLLILQVGLQNYRTYGNVLGQNQLLAMMFGREVLSLGLTDGVMCASTAVGLGLQLVIYKGYLSWDRSGWILQNIWQTFYLGAIMWWTHFRSWPWTHAIFIVLHGLVFIMKQHSYAFYNGYLSQVYKRRQRLETYMWKLGSMSPVTSPVASPVDKRNSTPNFAESPTNLCQRRHKSLPGTAEANLSKESEEVSSIASAISSNHHFSSDEMEAYQNIISAEMTALDEELKGRCSLTDNHYPRNLTLFNWAEWTCMPTLVYELEYPRQDKINWAYVAEKTGAIFGVLIIMQTISQAYIYPPMRQAVLLKEQGISLEQRWQEFPYLVFDMLFPLLLEQLLTWYLIWECVLNVLAELTYFADRGFYGNWWSSVSWDQYARDWNRPVHNFLLRHVYNSSISTFHLSKTTATFVTFLLSALVHELLMFVLFKKVRGYLFTAQLLQMPLVMFSRTKFLKGRNVLGNVIFWFGLFIGPAFLTSLYLVV